MPKSTKCAQKKLYTNKQTLIETITHTVYGVCSLLNIHTTRPTITTLMHIQYRTICSLLN
jgi:hypothetical protein